MRRPIALTTAGVIAGLLATVSGTAAAEEPIVLKDMGSFHVGGRVVEVSGQQVREVRASANGVPAKVDPNGRYVVEQMYVQYFIPQNERGSVPLLLWHGGGLSGVAYETTPDGRPGWLNDFLRKGWAVYNSDAVERGRSGWPAIEPRVFAGEAMLATPADAFGRFRIGAGANSWSEDPVQRKTLPGSQFPADATMQFAKQFVPRWLTTDAPIIRAYTELVDKVGPAVVLFHSQAGQFGFKVAQARPDKIKALVAVEPADVGDFDAADKLKDIPILMIYGDFIEQDARWPKIRQRGLDFAAKVRAAGGSVDVIDLPAVGIKGNSHMMMMDKNNLQVSSLINDWLAKKGLYR
jgi:pimeloyl-ACP methyl ester carboxylesterase